MRMKEDHMKNGQLKSAYNVQIGVESEYIVGLGLFPNPTDTTTLIPFLERLAKDTGRKYEKIIADAGYASEENYTYLEENGITQFFLLAFAFNFKKLRNRTFNNRLGVD